ncbi:class I adenylate-forming enzyme family protein [Streptomyces sp. NPDC001118]
MTEPARPAIVEGEASLAYGELDRMANCLAAHLAALDPQMPRAAVRTRVRTEWFVVNLALAKLGWEQVTINWRLTAAETSDILRDCRPGVLFCDDAGEPGELPTRARELGITVVRVEPGPHGLSSLLDDPAPPALRSEGPAALITYSSGTTGTARGMRKPRPRTAEHRRMLREYLIESEADKEASSLENRTLLTLPLHHGAGPNTALSALSHGGTLYLLPRFDPVAALEAIQRHGITRWTAVPTMLKRIRALPAEVLNRFDVSSVRRLGIGSAPTPFALKQWIISYFGDDCLVEVYGASEVGFVTLMPPHMHLAKPGSCGRLRRHVRVRVIGPDGAEVPRGVEGELCIRTPLTIDGYLDRRWLGTDSLTDDGYFRIGDIGKLDEDGYLYITGRKKDMIVSGGVNIYPVEIEHALAEHPDVVDAAVFGIPHHDLGEQVMAVCEVAPGSAPTVAELLGFLAPRLAPFKRPRRIEFTGELPRSDIGKVLKRTLRDPFWAGRGTSI